MTEQRLNNFVILHICKKLTNEINLVSLGKEFVNCQNEESMKYFGNYWSCSKKECSYAL